MNKNIIAVLSILLIFSDSYSFNSEALIFSYTSEKKDNPLEITVVTGSNKIYRDVKLAEIIDSNILISKDTASSKIHIEDIKSIKIKGRGFWTGAAVGGVIGFGIGFFAGANATDALYAGTQDHSILGLGILLGVIFAVPAGLIGGGIQSLLTEDKYYDLCKLDFEAKRKKLKNLMREFSN